jgi:hypothetical protein
MNYQLHYNKLIDKAVSEGRKKYKKDDIRYVYYEKHHIIPRCMGGTDDRGNIVLLLASEHYLAHQLLVKIYPDHHGILYSAIRLTHSPSKQRTNNKLHSWLRVRFSESLSILNKEGKMGARGPLTPAHKEKISRALKGRILPRGPDSPNFGSRRTEETRQKMRDNNYFNNGGKQLKDKDSPSYGLKRSQKTRDKISNARTGVSNGKRTEETRQKMRDARKLQTVTSQKSMMVFGVRYSSLKEACDSLNRNHRYIIHRLRSEDYPDCYYL